MIPRLIAGDSPYYGQVGWFLFFAPPAQRNAVVAERYQNEILRVLGVLDGVLANQEWLVGNKLSVADISFAM